MDPISRPTTRRLPRSRICAVTAAAVLTATAVTGLATPGRAATAGHSHSYSHGSKKAPATAPAFSTYSLGENQGVTCPGSAQCGNIAAEPQIRAAGDGSFYGSSENGLGGGTIAFKSTDGGAHYTTLASPNQGSSSNNSGFAPGGGDTDVAVAPVKNSSGNYNVYVASLSLANVDVSTSADGGKTWSLNPTSATIPGDDREWIAADGASKACISYHDVATFNIDVACSTDAGHTFLQPSDAIDANHAWLVDNNEIGNMAIDPSSHVIYQIFSGIGSQSDATSTSGVGYHAVWMGVSTDGGQTFTDHPVYINPNTSADYGHQFVQTTVDAAGNVYAVYSDNHNLYYSYSTDHGQTWSAPVQVNSGPSATAVMPWSVAAANGHLDVAWYGTSYYDGKNPPDNYPSSAQWHVYFAQNLNATAAGSSFSQTAATPVIHSGAVCEGGISCSGNRDLYDDFGIAANPLTGLASIDYSDDQYDPSGPNSSGCSASTSDSASCDHTAIATQTSGSGI